MNEYAFGFADGTSTLTPDPRKIFHAPNVYPVRLTVTDDDGNTGHCGTEIRVPEPRSASHGGVAPLVVGLAALARRRSAGLRRSRRSPGEEGTERNGH